MSNVKKYLYDDECVNFAMVSASLYRNKEFQQLSHASRDFYMVCATYREEIGQKKILYNALKDYYERTGQEISGYDLRLYSGQVKKDHAGKCLFVIPQSALSEFGYSPQYANKLKKELIEHGFIRVFANNKQHSENGMQGANRDFSKTVTIYEFITSWKEKE